MTVIQLISSEGYYGAESMLVALAGSLSACGMRTVVGVFHDRRSPHLEVADHARSRGVPVETIFCRGRWDWRTVHAIRGLIDRYGADVLHTHGYKADVYGYAALRRTRAAIVSTCHNWPSQRPIMRMYAKLDRLVLRRFDRVAAASEPVAEILRGAGIPGAAAVTNGIDVVRFTSGKPVMRSQVPQEWTYIVGFAGRLVAEKGCDLLIRAARSVLVSRPDTGFVFVGDGEARPGLERLAQSLGITGNVLFTGVRTDMPDVYASLDVLVLPSRLEATPMCLLEAMAAGVPVIATRVGSVPKVVLPGVTGLLLEPGDADGLAKALTRVLDEPDLARSLGEHGRAHIAEHFSAHATASAYAQLYEQAVTHRRQHRSIWVHHER